MIGVEDIPKALRVEPVVGEDWIYPNDPRCVEIGPGG